MTEDEARTKWCPFGRACVGMMKDGSVEVNAGAPAFNRVMLGGDQAALFTLCVASQCAVWIGGPKDSAIGYCGLLR
jgi:hypothetical protein